MEEKDKNQSGELLGTVIFQKANAGSKSESVQPFLYISQDKIIHLFLKGSNPFENSRLKEYDGKFVSIKGKMSGGTFLVESISALNS